MKNIKRIVMIIIAFMVMSMMSVCTGFDVVEAKKSVSVKTSTNTNKGKKSKKKKKSKKSKTKKKTKVKKKTVSAKGEAKKAFEKINSIRNAVGLENLEWSDELYDACLYRLKNSGYDKHDHINRDLSNLFGGFCYTIDGYEGSGFAENLAMGQNSIIDAVKSWKKSKGHYRNMISSDHKSCAVAKYKNMYITLFSDKTAEQIKEWRNNIDSGNLAVVTVREIDSVIGGYISSANIICYDVEDKWNKRVSVRIKSEDGVKLRLVVGHTYIIMDKSISEEDGKVGTVKITVSKDECNEVELIS